jgi:hypothetical protein
VQQHLYDAFDMRDRLREETPHVDGGKEDTLDDMGPNLKHLEELMDQATKPLYDGLNVSLISATIVLVNMAMIHGVSNAYMDELLKYLGTVLLPSGNVLPQSHREAKKVIQKLGLNYEIIDCCSNGCVLYRLDLRNLSDCPKCGTSRFIAGSDTIPARVVRYFPLIPRLLRMYRSAKIAKLLCFHVDHPNLEKDEVMRSVADSPARKHVDEVIDPSFAHEVRNLRFGLALDEVNPFRHNNTQHSTWPILMVIYNLPPYLVMKKFFIQLCILISGKQSPTTENIDVFLRPLVDELKLLWEGISAQDFLQALRERQFNLRGILMWTISDYPAYGLILGLCTHGYKACVVCGPQTESRCAKSGNKLNGEQRAQGNKIIHLGTRRWTHRGHPYRRNLNFNGKTEDRSAPRRMCGTEIARCAEERTAYLRDGGRPDERGTDPVHVHGVKRLSVLNELSYWKVSAITSVSTFHRGTYKCFKVYGSLRVFFGCTANANMVFQTKPTLLERGICHVHFALQCVEYFSFQRCTC